MESRRSLSSWTALLLPPLVLLGLKVEFVTPPWLLPFWRLKQCRPAPMPA
jgi:hypothetical protein